MLIVEAIKHREQLVARAAKIVGSDAEDVVSEVMIYLMEGRFNAPDKPLPLLMWYVKNRSIQHLRKRRTEQKAMVELRHMPEDEAPRRQDIDRLEQEMRKLPPLVARLMVMHYAEGMTLPEMEKAIGLKQSRIEYLIITGKKQLRNGTEN